MREERHTPRQLPSSTERSPVPLRVSHCAMTCLQNRPQMGSPPYLATLRSRCPQLSPPNVFTMLAAGPASCMALPTYHLSAGSTAPSQPDNPLCPAPQAGLPDEPGCAPPPSSRTWRLRRARHTPCACTSPSRGTRFTERALPGVLHTHPHARESTLLPCTLTSFPNTHRSHCHRLCPSRRVITPVRRPATALGSALESGM